MTAACTATDRPGHRFVSRLLTPQVRPFGAGGKEPDCAGILRWRSESAGPRARRGRARSGPCATLEDVLVVADGTEKVPRAASGPSYPESVSDASGSGNRSSQGTFPGAPRLSGPMPVP